MKTVSTSNHPPTPVGRQMAYVFGITALLMTLPLIAMQFTNEVNWTLSDFVIGGGLIATIGLLYIGASRLVKTRQQRWMVGGRTVPAAGVHLGGDGGRPRRLADCRFLIQRRHKKSGPLNTGRLRYFLQIPS